MLKIAHRGNTHGKRPDLENDPRYILDALEDGYDAEIDLWGVDGHLWLGHDRPTFKTDFDFLDDHRLWMHAKNHEAFHILLDWNNHCFWHDKDDFTFTSRGIVWCNMGKWSSEGILVLPELVPEFVERIKTELPVGICCDDFTVFE